MNQAVLQHLPPEHVEVEIGRADALEVRHGPSANKRAQFQGGIEGMRTTRSVLDA
jgi:hypothetical protein